MPPPRRFGDTRPDPDAGDDVERLRAVVQDAHLNFLIGAGTSSRLFAPLGNVEQALSDLERSSGQGVAYELARASIQALLFDTVLWPNTGLISGVSEDGEAVISSYERFGRALNRLLLARRSTLLNKQVSLFTTNVDLVFEVAFERLGLGLNDGFTGRFLPTFDPGSFGTVRYRSSPRYGHRSEIPTFDLVKIHGSVGWYWLQTEEGSPSIGFDRDLGALQIVKKKLDAVRDALVGIESPQKVSAADVLRRAQDVDRPAGLDAFVQAYESLVVVQPEKTKFATTVLTETYYELIRRFANDLERESSVLFVHGFSFRDEHLRKIVTRAARSNPTLQIYVFCYTAADEQAYRKLLPDAVVPNGNVEYLVPPHAKAKLDLDAVVELFFLPILDGSDLADPRNPQRGQTT